MSTINNSRSSIKKYKMERVVIECSDALGDTIGIMPYVDKYRIDNNCNLSVKINSRYKFMFEKSYPDLNYVNHVNGFDKVLNPNYNFYQKLHSI